MPTRSLSVVGIQQLRPAQWAQSMHDQLKEDYNNHFDESISRGVDSTLQVARLA